MDWHGRPYFWCLINGQQGVVTTAISVSYGPPYFSKLFPRCTTTLNLEQLTKQQVMIFTLQGINISPWCLAYLKMMFLFPRWYMWISWRVTGFFLKTASLRSWIDLCVMLQICYVARNSTIFQTKASQIWPKWWFRSPSNHGGMVLKPCKQWEKLPTNLNWWV